jgi:hypothetical protein
MTDKEALKLALEEKFSLLLWDYQELERAFEKVTGGKWVRKSNTPQRTWAGLTDSEWSDLYETHHDKYNLPVQGSPDGMDYERAIEAALRSKNT